MKPLEKTVSARESIYLIVRFLFPRNYFQRDTVFLRYAWAEGYQHKFATFSAKLC